MRPRVERLARSFDRAVYIDPVGLGHLGESLFGRRVDGRKALLAVRVDHPAAYEQPISRLDLDVVDRLWRGRVLEDLLRELGGLLLGDRHG